MFWDCHINKMYFKPNQLIPKVIKKIKRRLYFIKQRKLNFFQGFIILSMRGHFKKFIKIYQAKIHGCKN